MDMDTKTIATAAVSAVAFGAALAFYFHTEQKYRAAVAEAASKAAEVPKTIEASPAAPAPELPKVAKVAKVEGALSDEQFVKVFTEFLKQLEHWVLQLLGQFHHILAAARLKPEQERLATTQQVGTPPHTNTHMHACTSPFFHSPYSSSPYSPYSPYSPESCSCSFS